MAVEKIHKSIYFHPFINGQSTELLEQLKSLLKPQEAVAFFRASSSDGENPNQQKISELGGAITGTISQVIVKLQAKEKKILIPFCFMPSEDYLALFLEKAKIFASLPDVFQVEKEQHPRSYLLLNLVESEEVVLEKFSSEQLEMLKQHMNEDNLLDSSTVRKSVFPTRFKAIQELSFGKVLELKAIQSSNFYLLKTQEQMVLVGHKALSVLQRCAIVFQDSIAPVTLNMPMSSCSVASPVSQPKVGEKRKFEEDAENNNPSKTQKVEDPVIPNSGATMGIATGTNVPQCPFT